MLKTMRQLVAKFKATFWVWPEDSYRRLKVVFRWSLLVLPIWFMPWVFTVPFGLSVYLPYSADGESRYLRAVGPVAGVLQLSEWVSQQEIPKACMAAVVAAEDTRFYEHFGLDLDSIEKVLAKKKRSQANPERGASTITQQLVKNLYLSRDKTYLRKLREALGAVTLEAMVSKETILTWYLNSVEFGPEVYGIERAAEFYFGKKAVNLSPYQCVALAVVLPSPNRWNSSLVSKQYSNFFRKRYSVIARRMKILKQVDYRILAMVSSLAPFSVAEGRTKQVESGKGLSDSLQEMPDFPDELPTTPTGLEEHYDPFGDSGQAETGSVESESLDSSESEPSAESEDGVSADESDLSSEKSSPEAEVEDEEDAVIEDPESESETPSSTAVDEVVD